jgi:hypothetical protein
MARSRATIEGTWSGVAVEVLDAPTLPTAIAAGLLARRLAGILYALLRDGGMFEPQRVRSPRHPAAGAAALVACERVDAALAMWAHGLSQVRRVGEREC